VWFSSRVRAHPQLKLWVKWVLEEVAHSRLSHGFNRGFKGFGWFSSRVRAHPQLKGWVKWVRAEIPGSFDWNERLIPPLQKKLFDIKKIHLPLIIDTNVSVYLDFKTVNLIL
jgi:hypothetical protein